MEGATKKILHMFKYYLCKNVKGGGLNTQNLRKKAKLIISLT